MISARVPLLMTESVCRKSPANTKVIPPMSADEFLRSFKVPSTTSICILWLMVHSSHIINEASCSNLPRGPFLGIEHVDCCSRFTDNGSLKVK